MILIGKPTLVTACSWNLLRYEVTSSIFNSILAKLVKMFDEINFLVSYIVTSVNHLVHITLRLPTILALYRRFLLSFESYLLSNKATQWRRCPLIRIEPAQRWRFLIDIPYHTTPKWHIHLEWDKLFGFCYSRNETLPAEFEKRKLRKQLGRKQLQRRNRIQKRI